VLRAETSQTDQRQLRFTPPTTTGISRSSSAALGIGGECWEVFNGNVEGENLSPRELQGKYIVALGKIGGETGSDDGGRRKPIYERNSHQTERQAIAEAANALSALWKVRRSYKA